MMREVDKPGAVQALFDDLQVRISDLSQLDAPKYLRPIGEILGDVNTQVLAAKNSEGHVIGIPTGFDVDKYTGGLHDSNLRIVAARPGMGKSAWALSEAFNIAKKGYGVAMFSLEMPALQLGMRLVSMDSEFTVSDLRAGRVDDNKWQQFSETLARLQQLPIFIDDTAALTTFELRARVKRWKSEINNGRYPSVTKQRIGAVYVDYLQLMKPARPSGSREVDVSSISRELKESAKQLNVPVTAMAQLNREVEKGADKRPQLHHLRESGSVEADADDILLLYRPEYYVRKGEDVDPEIEGLCEVIVAKQRNGAPGVQRMTFVAKHMRFANRAGEEYDFSDYDDYPAR
jgi:replicative DNA helicase